MTRIEYADRMISLKCIENDLVIRLSKFDDNDKRVHSFQRALLEIPKSNKEIEGIKQKYKSFKTLIKDIKIRRHEVLAHLKIGEADEIDPCYDLKPAIKLVVEIIDLIAEAKISYKWSDGRYEKYDFRIAVLNENETVSNNPNN
jgi:hypothetical protein